MNLYIMAPHDDWETKYPLEQTMSLSSLLSACVILDGVPVVLFYRLRLMFLGKLRSSIASDPDQWFFTIFSDQITWSVLRLFSQRRYVEEVEYIKTNKHYSMTLKFSSISNAVDIKDHTQRIVVSFIVRWIFKLKKNRIK